jgi:hypothetical protein
MLIVFIRLFLIPLAQRFGWMKRMTQLEAAQLIGSMFSDIADRLTNTLQLISQSSSANENLDLLTASIAQKTSQLTVFNFSSAIDLSVNKKYAKVCTSFTVNLIVLSFYSSDS